MKREREVEENQEAEASMAEQSPAKRQKAEHAAGAPASRREERDGDAAGGRGSLGEEAPAEAATAAAGQEAGLDDADEERIVLPTSTTRSAIKKGRECPYLDTISRQVRFQDS